MSPETCAVCGGTVPFDSTVHLLVHTHDEEGAIDYYVCEDCYETDFAPLVA
jgi:hypothetical protein